MNEQNGWPSASNRLFIGLHLSVWLFIFSLSWVAFLRLLPLSQSFVRAALNTIGMVVLFYVIGFLYQKYYEHRAYWRFGVGLILIFGLVTAFRFQLNSGFSYVEGANPYYNPGPVSFFFGALITNVTTLLNSLLYQLVRSRVILKQRQASLLAEQREAKLQFLRAQMNPHFLFNTLNNIYSLAVVKSEKTAPLVLRLSDLLQYVIYDAQQNRTPLAKEITVLEEYISLFQLQHEEPVQVEFDYQLPRQKILIEPLLLVPIVENCFKHGDHAENPDAFVRLSLSVKEDQLHFRAENSYNPLQDQKDRTGGVGLENIRRRLQLQYPDRHTLDIKTLGKVFCLELNLELQNSLDL